MKKGSAGGKARAITAKVEARNRYFSNPSICKECKTIIIPILYGEKFDYSGARKKKFCTKSCSAIYNNKIREIVYTKRHNNSICECGEIKTKKSKQCRKCFSKRLVENRTYKYYKDKYTNWWSSRAPIAKNARKVYDASDKKKSCFKCNYSKHYQVCHIKPVASFNDNTLIKEINNLNNLVALCPNCHWEYDNGLIKL